MNKLSLILSISLLLMVVGGCKNGENTGEVVTDQNQQTTNQQQTQNFSNPIEEGKKSSPPALTVSTNPDQRYSQIPRGSSIPNRNPFATIIPPVVVDGGENGAIAISPLETGNGKGTKVNATTSGGKGTPITSSGRETPITSRGAGKTVTQGVKLIEPQVTSQALNQTPTPQQTIPDNILPPPELIPEISGIVPTNPSGQIRTSGSIPQKRPDFTLKPIPKPEPDQAREVIVSGILEINGEQHAIVKAPGEVHSRYVKTGDLLSNGQVLVKRISADQNNPHVILEQLGQEVFLVAGAKNAE